MKCALVQMDIIFEDIEKNKIIVKNKIQYAKNNNARIVFFPEMTFTGFTMNQIVDETIKDYMLHLSKEYEIAIGYGNIIDGYYNTFEIVDKGKELCTYKKIHPFLQESNYYQKGEEIVSATIDDLTFVPTICFDLRFPVLYYLAKDKGNVIVNIASWPSLRDEHWKALLKARAIETQKYVLGINRVGKDPYCTYIGNSIAYDGWGTPLNEYSDKDEVIFVEIEKKEYPANFVECERDELYKKMMK